MPHLALHLGLRFRHTDTMKFRVSFIAPLVAVICVGSVHADKSDKGDCSSKIQLEMNADGRTMTVLKQADYIDPSNVHWIAPANAKVDGASIPQAFWSVSGGPFEGLYRYASVFHDVACNERNHTWQSTHQMFYDAMKCSGVGEAKAKVMFFAVWAFGPRWRPPVRGGGIPRKLTVSPEALPNQADVKEIEKWIRRENPGLQRLEEVADSKRPK